MGKGQARKAMFSLSPVEFRDSPIAGRGVFARRAIRPGDVIVPYAPRQRRLDPKDPQATAAAETRLTLLVDERTVIVPDTMVPGGWLCNHSCDPNAALYSSGEGRIQCTRAIAPGEEVTVFYGWVSHNQPGRDPCLCGSTKCRRFINFDLSDEDAARARVLENGEVVLDGVLQRRLAEYGEFLRSIDQEQVLEIIATTLVRIKLRKPGSVVCAY